jgi:hypothetical protein
LRQGLTIICMGWLQTSIFLISDSWVARITGVSQGAFVFWHMVLLHSPGHLELMIVLSARSTGCTTMPCQVL